jgi:hypothetical protein
MADQPPEVMMMEELPHQLPAGTMLLHGQLVLGAPPLVGAALSVLEVALHLHHQRSRGVSVWS